MALADQTHPLSREQRAELRQAIDAARRELIHRRRFTHRVCSGCGQYLHKAEFVQPAGMCHLCEELKGDAP